MSAVASAESGKSMPVMVIGLVTLLWGIAHVVWGGLLVLGGDALAKNLQPDDPAGGLAPLLAILAGLMIVIGVGFLLLGGVSAFAGLGVLWRKQWGRILALLVAGLSLLMGLLSLTVYKPNANGNGTLVTFAAVEILYGIATCVILIKNGRAFSQS